MLLWETVKSPSCKIRFSSWLFCSGSSRDFSGQLSAYVWTELRCGQCICPVGVLWGISLIWEFVRPEVG